MRTGFLLALVVAACLTLIVSVLVLQTMTAEPATSANEEIRDLILRARYPQAEQTARDLLATAEKEHRAHSLEAAAALDLLVEARWRGSRVLAEGTLRMAERALAIRRETLGDEHPLTLTSLNTRANVIAWRGDVKRAEEEFTRVLGARERLLGPDHLDVAITLRDYADFLDRIQEDRRALPLLRRALEIAAESPEAEVLHAIMLHELGWHLFTLGGQRNEAAEVVERAADAHERAALGDHPAMAFSLHVRGRLSWSDDRDGCIKLHRQALHLRERLLGPSHHDTGKSCGEVGVYLVLSGQVDEGMALMHRQVEILESSVGSDNPQLWSAHNALGVLLNRLDREREALEAYRRALAIAERAFSEDHHRVVYTLGDIAPILVDLGEREEALAVLQRATTIAERIFDPDDARLAWLVNDKGRVHMKLGDPEAALESFRRATEIWAAANGPDHPNVATGESNMGWALNELLRYDESAVHGRRALEIYEKDLGPDSTFVADALYDLGYSLAIGGRLDEASLHLERALRIREKELGAEHSDVAHTLKELAIVRSSVGDYAGTRSLRERAIEIFERTEGPDSLDTAEALHDFALDLMRWGRAEEALPPARRAVAVVEKVRGPEHRKFQHYSTTLAAVLSDLGKHEEALAVVGRLDRLEERLGFGTRILTYHAVTRAVVLAAAGKSEEARKAFERAVTVLEDSEAGHAVRGPLNRGEVLLRRAYLEWRLGERTDALSFARRAAEDLDRYARETLALFPEKQALWLVASEPAFTRYRGGERPDEILFSALLEEESDESPWVEACWESMLRRHGMILDVLAARNRAAFRGEEAEAAWERLATARRQLAALWVRGASVESGDLARATKEKEDAEQALARLVPEVADIASLAGTTLPELGDALPAGSALVEYVRVPVRDRKTWRSELRDVALVFPAGGKGATFVDLGPSKRTDDLVRSWRRNLHVSFVKTETGGHLDAGLALRRAIWDPVARKLGDAQRVFVVPDGPLHQVHFAALPASRKRYLIEDGPSLHLLSAARDLVRLRDSDAPEPGKGVLALGSPDYEAGATIRIAGLTDSDQTTAFRGKLTGCPKLRDVSWTPLPATGAEVTEIAKLFESHDDEVTRLTGSRASEERFKREAPGKRVLHLATHGFFLQGECVSAEALGRGIGTIAERKEEPVATEPQPVAEETAVEEASPAPAVASSSTESMTPTVAENPLLLSGLALAGANRAVDATSGQEDGILTAEEIAALDLRGVEIASLSACDTGLGTVEVGEGVFGLRRALEIAGVRTVLMSLWPVPDVESREWMTRFYESKLDGQSVTDASRGASLKMLKRLREEDLPTHPYLWAGFVAAGDWQ